MYEVCTRALISGCSRSERRDLLSGVMLSCKYSKEELRVTNFNWPQPAIDLSPTLYSDSPPITLPLLEGMLYGCKSNR